MNISRHISIDDEYIRKMEPYLSKHNGNMGAALREMITMAGRYNPAMNSSAIDTSLFNWMAQETDDTLLPAEILDKLIDPGHVNSMEKLEKHMNQRFADLEWETNVSIKCDNDTFPSGILLTIRGSPLKIKFIAGIISQFIVRNTINTSPLEIRSVSNFNECIKIEMVRSDKTASEISLMNYFGGKDEMFRAIKSRPEFWAHIVRSHTMSNYNMVTVHRNFFEDILANNIPLGDITIEFLAKRPVHEIPLSELLHLLKDVYETSRIVDRIEIEDDTVIIFHSYRVSEAVERLKKIILSLLESNGHLYDGRSTANMIVLTHRPDIGIKINELIDNLKNSTNGLDKQLLLFITFLNGLKDIPDIPLSLSVLGRRLGRSMMQAYEKEHNIKEWTPLALKKAFEVIDGKLMRDSRWKIEGNELKYTITKCSISRLENDPNKCICYTIREAFKGAVSYAFKKKAEIYVQKLLSQGDNFCEVVIRTP